MSTLPTPVIAIKGAVCFTCYKEGKLSKCGRCKRVWYCGSACQKKDWERGHKKLCPALQALDEADPDAKPPQTWEQYRQELWNLIDIFRLSQPHFSVNDERIIQYQPYCTGCHRTTFTLPADQKKLSLCPKCKIAAHCPSCSLSSHDSVCEKLKEIMIADRFATAHYNETGEPSLQMPTETPRTKYVPLSSAKSWYEYYTKISDKQMVEGLLTHDLKPVAENDEMASALQAATYKMSMMLSIIAGLEAAYPDIGTKQKITLHLIGADKKELDALMLFEEILHLLPALKAIHCVFIGIELPSPIDASGKMTLDCCLECTKLNKIRSLEMYKGAYHDFLTQANYETPDLGVAFQTGHSQESVASWRPTVEYLVGADHCTMFTTFNEKELVEEVEILRSLNARFLVEGGLNKWRGMRPLLEVLEEREYSVYSNHQFWYVVKGKGVGK